MVKMKRIERLSLIVLLIAGSIPTDTLALRPAAYRSMDGEGSKIIKQVSGAEAGTAATLLLEKSPFVYRDADGKIVLRLFSDFDETVTPPYRQQELRISEQIAAFILTDDIRRIRSLIKIKQAVRTVLPHALSGRLRRFLGVPPGLLTLDDCRKMSESTELNENFVAVLEAIKEMTGVDKIELTIVSGGIGQISRMYFRRPDVMNRFEELSTEVVGFFANTFDFDQDGVFTGKVTGPKGRLVIDKTKFVDGGALFLGDKREKKHNFKYLINVNEGTEAAVAVFKGWIDAQLQPTRAEQPMQERTYQLLLDQAA